VATLQLLALPMGCSNVSCINGSAVFLFASGCNKFAHISDIMLYRMFFNKIDAFTALLFTGIGAPLAAERMRILLMTQHASNIHLE
jgi:hypothetical protein